MKEEVGVGKRCRAQIRGYGGLSDKMCVCYRRVELAPKSWTGLILGGEGLKGLIPIVHRGQALESLLDAFGVVPLDVVFDGLVKVLDGVEDFSVVHLGFQVAKEVLHYCVVVAVGFSRH